MLHVILPSLFLIQSWAHGPSERQPRPCFMRVIESMRPWLDLLCLVISLLFSQCDTNCITKSFSYWFRRWNLIVVLNIFHVIFWIISQISLCISVNIIQMESAARRARVRIHFFRLAKHRSWLDSDLSAIQIRSTVSIPVFIIKPSMLVTKFSPVKFCRHRSPSQYCDLLCPHWGHDRY